MKSRSNRHSSTKSDRLEARLLPEDKALFVRAADYKGISLTEFVKDCVRETAKKIIRRHEQISLSLRDRKVFVESLLNPPQPSPKLKQAYSRYNKG